MTEALCEFSCELVPPLGVVKRGTEGAVEIGQVGVDGDGLICEVHGG